MKKIFRWGIIGPGRIAHKFAAGLKVVKNASLYAVASQSMERAQAFARQYQAQKAYSTYEELVNDPQVDAVYIATPHVFHYENTRLCLEAGKAVLCEKPLTVNAAQSKKLLEISKRKSVFLMEALWSRFLPAYQQVREWLQQDRIGDLMLLSSSMGFRREFDAQERLFNPHLAGGALLDLGIYPIAISQFLMGENPTSFSVNSVLGKSQVDEMTCAYLHYKSGIGSQFCCTFRAETLNDLYIYGSKGRIRIQAPFWQSEKVNLSVSGKEKTLSKPFRASGFEYEIEEVTGCVREGRRESASMPQADTQANMELMDAMRKQIGLRYPFE